MKSFTQKMSIKLLVLAFLAVFQFSLAITIPVLCYHQVIPLPKGKYEISPEAFRAQLLLMKAQGYRPVNSRECLDLLNGHLQPTGNPVVITFDDGYKSVFHYAFPIMKELNMVGVACIYPQFINSGGGMTWDNLKTMAADGWSIESHSYSHPDLFKAPSEPGARKAFFEKEIAQPRKEIQEHLGKPPLFMVWPYGIYTEETEAFAKACGYAGALTVDGGGNYPGIDPFRIKRPVIYQSDNQEKFLIRLEMAGLEVKECSPRPGEVVKEFTRMECVIPSMAGQDISKFVINAKVNGGSLTFQFDPKTLRLTGWLQAKLARGQHFIDVYLRDSRTGVTSQNGWLFTLQ